MSFDDIPEDREPSYSCDCGGSIKLNKDNGQWECDSCDRPPVESEMGEDA